MERSGMFLTFRSTLKSILKSSSLETPKEIILAKKLVLQSNKVSTK